MEFQIDTNELIQALQERVNALTQDSIIKEAVIKSLQKQVFELTLEKDEMTEQTA